MAQAECPPAAIPLMLLRHVRTTGGSPKDRGGRGGERLSTAGEHRAGFVALVGRPNVGKSTLMNRLIGRKVAIVSDKPQTTRNRIAGICTRDDHQIIFMDTPGVHRSEVLFNREMVKVALKTLDEVDVTLWLMDAADPLSEEDRFLAQHLRSVAPPVLLALNKVDLVRKETLLPLIDRCAKGFRVAEVVPISAKTGDNLPRLEGLLRQYLPVGPPLYPPDRVTDQPEHLLVGEIIREKVLALTHDEIPYAVAVRVEEMREREGDGILDVQATIFVEKDSQKGILIGAGGQRLKRIGQMAREDMEGLFGTRVYLGLWVKVLKAWRKDPEWLRRLGYLP